MNIVNKTCALTIAILSFFASVSVANQKSDLSQYDVVWNSMSHNSSESMPCGGGDIGTNVWVENGDIMLYLSKSGAFDENGIFPKFGRIRIHFKQSPFKGGLFQQKLHLNKGFITINGKNAFTEVALKVWVDVFHPFMSTFRAPNPLPQRLSTKLGDSKTTNGQAIWSLMLAVLLFRHQ